MPDLQFSIESAAAERYALAPLLLFKVRLTDCAAAPQPIHGVLLNCQVRIEPAQRSYAPAEQERLQEIFGSPQQWSRSLHSMLWTHTQVIVPAFARNAAVNLPVPCSFDLSIAVTKYIDALAAGPVPLLLLFSGTIFYAAANAPLQAAPIAWDREARFRLPVQVWKELMERYYPNSAWLCLPRDLLDRLRQYRLRSGLLTWEQALERLLEAETAELGAPT